MELESGMVPEGYVEMENVGVSDIDQSSAFFEVLKDLGYPIYLPRTTGWGIIIPRGRVELRKVMVSPNEVENVKELYRLYQELPEARLFSLVARFQPSRFRFIRKEGISFSWIQENQALIQRSLKAVYLLSARAYEEVGNLQRAEQEKAHASEISQPALDGEGMRIIIENKVRGFWEIHPELKPANQ